MKLNIDAEPKDMGIALSAFFSSSAQNPTQKPKEAVRVTQSGVNFDIVKNEDSYTVKAVYK